VKTYGKCHTCGQTLTQADWEAGRSGIVNRRLLCADCLDVGGITPAQAKKIARGIR
jgi:hypothetical protein